MKSTPHINMCIITVHLVSSTLIHELCTLFFSFLFSCSLPHAAPITTTENSILKPTPEPSPPVFEIEIEESPVTDSFVAVEEAPVVVLINECEDGQNGGCEHTCVDTPESYYCECPTGYMLDSDGRSCRCGGMFTENEGSFQTPGWPENYPQEDFTCEWRVTASDPTSHVEFTVDSSHYGINGRPPCTRDYLQFYNGLDNSDPIGEKYCHVHPPVNTIRSAGPEANVVFQGLANRWRPASRVGVKVNYRIIPSS